MKYRLVLLAAASAATLMADAAFAQDATEEATAVEQVVVTGVRAPRSRLDTVSPVDVVTSREMQQQATTEVGQALANVAPSIDFPRPTITDGTDSVRPATLRGLSPDQTLVLVNGIRQHASALVNLNGSIGRGSAAVDLNTIPLAAIGTVEILREGASAQYGSDAIAGVINLRLREARDGANVSANTGFYYTHVETFRTSYTKNDGAVVELSGWKGLPLPNDGFLTVSAEYRNRQPTHRSDIDPREPGKPEIRGRAGDPEVLDVTGYLNAGLPINSVWSAYGWLGYQYRDAESAATARIPSNPNNDINVYPDGFLPIINPIITDWSGAGGVRGEVGGWKVDANASFGQNRIHYYVRHSINGTLVPNSPTDFNAGVLRYRQWLANVDVDKSFGDWAVLAFGYEYRNENYRIQAGETASWVTGPRTGSGIGGGAQGFIGLFPQNETDRSRHSQSVYADLDVKPVKAWDIDFAARYEDYSDFGTKTTGKVATRYDFTDSFAVRGAYSTGFRAPGLQQQAFTSTAINFIIIGGVSTPTEVVTLPPSDPIAQSLGAQPLRPETSDNYSLGFIFHKGPFELTVDGYEIKIKDRIVLSENLLAIPATSSSATPASIAIFNLLNPTGGTLGGARFFINGVDSTTKGVDIVGRYRLATDNLGRFGITLAANFNHTDVTRVPAIPTNIPIPNPPALFARINVLTFEEGTPKYKYSANLDWAGGPWGANVKLTYYGNVVQPFSNTNPLFDVDVGKHLITDVEGRYKFNDKFVWAVGVNNLFDEYPEPTPIAAPRAVNTTGAVPFSNYSPFGFNGRFLYTRLSLDF